MKPFLIGCGIILLLFIGGVIAAFVFLPDVIKRGMEMANEAIEAEKERSALAVNFEPVTADEPAAEVFPAQLLEYKRTAADDSTGVPQLSIAMPGKHAVYEAGASKIDAYVFPYTAQQRATILKTIEDLNKGQGSSSWVKIDLGDDYARIHMSSGRLGSNYLWFTKTALVAFRTTDTEDREPVLKAFFTARQAAGAVEPAPAATKKSATGDAPTPVDPNKSPDGDGGKKDGSVRLEPTKLEPGLRQAA